jgi:hypothetical protein
MTCKRVEGCEDVVFRKTTSVRRTKAILSCVLLFASLVGGAQAAYAANYYVRSGATGSGNGSDWTNAYPSLPQTLQRGSTYFVAAGSYGDYAFDDANSGSSYIEIRKATADNHGTDTGWQAAYGTGAARWGQLSFRTSYYKFNGVTGHGADVGQYGFQQDFTQRTSSAKAFDVDGDFIEISHVKSFWTERDNTQQVQSRWLEGTTGSPNNITVSYVYVKELPGLPFYFISSTNIVVEYFVLEGMHSDATYHAEVASIRGLQNLTVRYSWFMDGNGTGGWMSMEGQNTGWRIYGNVFEQTSEPHSNSGFGHGIFADNMQQGSSTEAAFHNNTIANYTATLRSGLAFWAATSPVEWRNNIARNNRGFGNLGVDAGSHNYLSSVPAESEFNDRIETSLQRDSNDPFVDSARNFDRDIRDWELSGTNLPAAGTPLPAPYDQSCINRLWQGPSAPCVTRGADGRWDRGAIEYNAIQTTSRPMPPSDVRVQ